MALTFDVTDLYAYLPTADADRLGAMVEDALALATLAAPCLGDVDLSAAKEAQARAVIRSAIVRWYESGSGAVQTQQAGPFSQTIDTRQQRRSMFWPSEIAALRGICAATVPGRAFEIDPTPDIPSAPLNAWELYI